MNKSKNLKEETLEVLKFYGKTERDVVWIGSVEVGLKVELDNFWEVAEETYYDSSWGTAEIPTDLIIAGRNFWLEREEYDGSEWWAYRTMPPMPLETIEIDTLTPSDRWGGDLADCKKEGSYD